MRPPRGGPGESRRPVRRGARSGGVGRRQRLQLLAALHDPPERLARLRERVPATGLLITSRQRLALDGEQELLVPPLPVPPPAEVEHLIGDSAKARAELGWAPSVDFAGLIKMMVDADLERVEATPPSLDRLSAL